MSLITQAYLVEKFGLRLNVEQLGQVLDLAPNTIYNQVAKKTFVVPTYLDGGKRFADYRDVANYLDKCRLLAQTNI